MKKRIISALLFASMFCSSVLQELLPGLSKALAEGSVSEETSVQELMDGEEGFFDEPEAPAEEEESAPEEDDALAEEEESDSEEEETLADEEEPTFEEDETVVDEEESTPTEEEAVEEEETAPVEEEAVDNEEEAEPTEEEEVVDEEESAPVEEEVVDDEEEAEPTEEEAVVDEEETAPAEEEVVEDEEETVPAEEEEVADEEETVPEEDENPVELDDIEVEIADGTGDTSKGNENSSESTSGTLQALVDSALRSVTGTLKGKLEIILKKNTVYGGDVTIDAAGHDVANDFVLEMSAEDAGEDGLQANGSTQFTGFMSIRDLSVTIRGLSLTNAVTVQDAKLDYYGTTADDSVDITADSRAQVTIETGEGADDVNVTAMNGGSVEIETGEGDDQVSAIAKDQGSVVIETGVGDDSVALYQGEKAGKSEIDTGLGDDSIDITKAGNAGNVIVEAGAGDDTVAIVGGGKTISAQGDVLVDLGSGDDQVTVDMSVAKGTTKVDIQGDEGSDRVHFTGNLRTDVEPENRITGTAENLNMAGQYNTLNVTSSDVETLTDGLNNKRTVLVEAGEEGSQTVEVTDKFTNYVYDGPADQIGDLTVTAADGADLTLTSFVIDARMSGDKDYNMVIPEDATVTSKDVQLVLQGRDVTVNGTLKGDLVRINAFDSTTGYAPVLNVFGNEIPMDLLSISDQAHVTIGASAKIYSESDIIVEAGVEQDGGMITLVPGMNVINMKLAKAIIDVAGELYAGYDLDSETPNGERGSVRIAASTRTTAGFEEDGSVSNGLPFAINLGSVDAEVKVRSGAVIEASDSIQINSRTDLKIAAKADSASWLPVSVAINVLTSDAKSIVEGRLTAGKDVSISSSANVDARTLAGRGSEQAMGSIAAYLSTGIILQHAKAGIGGSALVDAGRDVSVKSYARENADTQAITAVADRETDSDDPITETIDLLTDLWSKIKGVFSSEEKEEQKKLDDAIAKISVSDHSVRVDEASKAKAGDLKVNSATAEDGTSTEIRVSVTPRDGYEVKAVTWRGLNPGDSTYTTGSAAKGEGGWTFIQQLKDVTIFVEYEELEREPETGDEEEPEIDPDLYGEDPEPQSLNVGEIVESLSDSTADLDEEEDVLPEVRNVALALSGKGGAVLTYVTEPANPTGSLQKVAPGQSVRLVVNPEEGKLLVTGTLKATYTVTEDGQEVTQTVIIEHDEQYRYFLNVPENIVESRGVQVKAEFADDSVEDRDPGHRGIQLAGAIAVNVTENNSQAVIDTYAEVTAGGDVELTTNAVIHVSALADGSAISDKKPSQQEEPEESYAIVRNDVSTITEEPVETGPRAGYTVSLRCEGIRTAEGAESGTMRLIDVITDENGKITEIVVEPVANPGFRLYDKTVTANTVNPDGSTSAKWTTRDDNGYFHCSTEFIPEGSQIALTATFASDDRYFRTQNDEHGWIILYDNYVRTGEHPVVTVQPDPNYRVKSVTATYQTPDGTQEVSYILEDPNGGSIVLDIPELKSGTRVYVSAEFEKKTIKLIPGGQSFGDQQPDQDVQYLDFCVLSEEYGTTGDTVRVTPSKLSVEDGYKVTHVKVTKPVEDPDPESQEFEEIVVDVDGDSFVVPEGMEDAKLTVYAVLGLKEIELNTVELEHGTLKPMTARADRGNTVDVHIDADDGYRIKQGKLKAILTSKDGTYREEIYMSRWTDFLYTFVVPGYEGDIADLEISFEGEFESGKAGEGTTTNIGAGLAVTYATSHNRADLKGTVIASGDISASAYADDSISTESAAGYTSGTMGISGALSVQIGSVDSKARTHDTAVLLLDGALALEAGQAVNFKVDADASGSKRRSQGMGIGAGLAVAIDGADAVASVHEDAIIKPLSDEDGIGGLVLRADQTVMDSVTAAAGAAGNGMTIMGAVAFDLTGTSATANMPQIKEIMFHVRNSASITASNLATHVIDAEGATVGKGTAAGAAIGASILNDVAKATLGQQLTAKSLTVAAVTESNVRNETKATASGGRIPFRLRLKDGILAMIAIPIMRLMAMSGNYYISKDQLDFILQFRLRILTTQGTMGLTAAAGFNHQQSKSVAEVLDGIDVDVAGRMIVRTENHTEAIVKGDGSTQDSGMGIGAGAGLNWVKLRNIASVGTGKIRAGSLEVSATTREKTTDYENLITGLETEEELTEILHGVVEDYVRSLVTEMGLFDLMDGNVMDEMIDPMVDDLTREILEASGLFEFLEDIDYEKVADVLIEDALPMAKKTVIPVLIVVGEFVEFEDDSYLERVRSAFIDTFNKTLLSSIDNDIKGMMSGTGKSIGLFLLNNTWNLLTGGPQTGEEVEKLKTNLGKESERLTAEALKKRVSEAVDAALEAVQEECVEITDEIIDEILNSIDDSGKLAKYVSTDTVKNVVEAAGDVYKLMTMDEIVNEEADKMNDVVIYDGDVCNSMVDNVIAPDYSGKVAGQIVKGAEEKNIVLNDEQLAILRDPSDLRTEAKRMQAGGHVIDTQAISGAGSRSIGLAGSAAYTNLNFVTRAVLAHTSVTETVTETNEDGEEEEKKVTTITPGGSVTVAGDLVVIANEKRFVNNVASAALNSRGNASANHAAGEAANLDVGTDEDIQSVAGNDKVQLTVGLGGIAEIPESEMSSDRPKIRINLKTGFALKADEQTGKSYASFSINDQSGYDVGGGLIEVKQDADGYYIDTSEIGDVGEDAQIAIELQPVEVLRNVPVPRVTAPMDVEADVVTVGVKNREVVGNKLSARAGDIVYVTVHKAKGRRVETIGYTYIDSQGRTRTVEINPSMTTSRDEAVFTQVKADSDEFTYAFRMPDGELTDIDVSFVEGDEMDASQLPYYSFTLSIDGFSSNGTGRGIGAGIGFAYLDGHADVEAVIGQRGDQEEGVTAGSITLEAISEREEEVASAAGTDPLSGASTADDASHLSLDASGALTMLDNTARAVMAKENLTKTTGYDIENEHVAGNLSITVRDSGESYITASAFNVGLKTAVGATVALNFGSSKAEASIGAVTVDGAVSIAASSDSRDYTSAVATAVGQDVVRVARWVKIDEDGTTQKTEEANDLNAKNITATKVNKELNDKKEDGGDDADNDLPLSMNVLRSQGVKTKEGEAEEESSSLMDDINMATGMIMGGVAVGYDVYNFFWGSKYQIAASVAMTRADHTADVSVEGKVEAGDGISLTAENNGNFATLGTSASASILIHSNSISGGAAVTRSYNRASVTVEDDLISARGGDITLSSDLKQNMDPEYADKLTSQSAAGSVSGYGSLFSFGGAVSLIQSKAVSTVETPDGESSDTAHSIKGGKITVSATDQTRLTGRAGGVSVSMGSTVGLGVAGTVILSGNKVRAKIGDFMNIEGTALDVIAEKMAVGEDDYENLLALRDGKNQDAVDVQEGEDDKHYDVKVNLSSNKLLKAFEKVNKYAFQNYYAEAVSGSAQISWTAATLSGAAAVIIPKNTVEALIGKNASIKLTGADGSQSEDEDDPGDGHMTVRALDNTNTRIVAGSVAVAPSTIAAGVTVSMLIDKNIVEASTGENATVESTGNLTHTAEATGKTQLFTAAAGVATFGKGSSNAFSATLNLIISKLKANNTIGDNLSFDVGGDVNVTSNAELDLLGLSVNATIAAGTNGTATGGVVKAIKDRTAAKTEIGNGDITAGGGMNFASDVSDEIISAAGSQAAAAASGVGLAAVINLVISGSSANVALDNTNLVAKGGDISATANSDALLMNASLALPGAGGTALGGSFNLNFLEREAIVKMTGGKADAAANVRFQSGGDDTSYLAGLIMAGSVKGGVVEGNLILQLEKNKIQSILKDVAEVKAGLNAVFESRFSDRTVAAAGSIALANVGNGVGITDITLKKNNSIKTILGVPVVTANTAGTGDAIKNLADEDVSGVYVGAVADENHTLAGAGIALSGSFAVTATGVTVVSENEAIADASQTTIKSIETLEGESYVFVGGTQICCFDSYYNVLAESPQLSSLKDAEDYYKYYNMRTGYVGIKRPDDTEYTRITSTNQLLTLRKSEGGDIIVEAANDADQLLFAGGLNFGLGLGIGAAAVVVVNNNDVKATLKSAEAVGKVDVSAKNREDLLNMNINAGGSPDGALQVGVTIVDLKSKVNALTLGDLKSHKGEINLTAENTVDKLINVAAAVGASGSWAAIPVFTYTGFKGETNAILGSGRIEAAKEVSVHATSDKTIDQIVVGAAVAKSLGLSGAVSVTDIKDQTNALVTYGTETTAKGLDINARSDYKQVSVSAALSATTDGEGIAASVNGVVSLLKASTLAEMEGEAMLEQDAKVKASAKRDVINVGAGMNFSGGTAGGMTVMVLVAGDEMDQDAADQLTYGDANSDEKKTFDSSALVKHLNDKGMDTSALATLEDDTKGNGVKLDQSRLGTKDGNGNPKFDGSSGVNGDSTEDEDDDKTDETEDVKNARYVGYRRARPKKTITVEREITEYQLINTRTKEVVGTYPTFEEAVDAARSMYGNFGTHAITRTITEEVEIDDEDWDESQAYTVYDSDPLDSVAARIGSNARIYAGDITVEAEQESLADLYAGSVNAAGQLSGGISFSALKLRSNVIATSLGELDANGNVKVSAISKSGEVTPEEGSDEDNRMKALYDKIENATHQNNRSIRTIGLVVGIGGEVGFAISAGATRLDNITQATLGGKVNNAVRVSVNSEAKYRDVVAATIALAGSGEAAIAGSIAGAVAEGTVSSKIESGTEITNVRGEIEVTTDSVVNVDTIAAAVAASGGGAIVAGLALSVNNLTQNTEIERGVTIAAKADEQPDLTVKATSRTGANAMLLGAQAGFVAVGMGAAIVKVKPQINTTLGWDGDEDRSTSLTNLGNVMVCNDVTSKAQTDILSATAGAVAVAGNVLLVYNDTDALAKVGAVTGKVNKLNINGKMRAAGTAQVTAIVAGGVSVGVTVSYVDVNAKNTADLDATDFRLAVDELNVTSGEEITDKDDWAVEAVAHSLASSMGLIAIGVNVALARNRVQNNAWITGENLNVGSVNVHSYTKGRAEAEVLGVNVGGIRVATSVIHALNEATSRSYIDLKGAMEGNLNATSDTKGKTTANLYTGGGSIIGVTTNVATARGRTASLVEANIGCAPVNAGNTYKVASTGDDTVKTVIDNLIGLDVGASVGVMVGRAFSMDVYDAKLNLTGVGTYKLKEVSVTTDYETDVLADTTPSSSGVNVNVVGVAVNKATAKNRSYAMATLYTQGDITPMEETGTDDPEKTTNVETTGEVNVVTTGSVNAHAQVHAAKFTWNIALGVGVSKANAAVNGSQAALLKLGKGGIEKAAAVNVRSVADKVNAEATVGGSGGNGKNVKLGAISIDSNTATASETFANTAAIMGGISGSHVEKGMIKTGHFETRYNQYYIDYDNVVDYETKKITIIEHDASGNQISAAGNGVVYVITDSNTREELCLAYSKEERDDMMEYYQKAKDQDGRLLYDPVCTEKTEVFLTAEDGKSYPMRYGNITVWVEDLIPANVTINEYEAEKNILKADKLVLFAGMKDGESSTAVARSDGDFKLGLVTVGDLNARSSSGESISALFEGVTATITGNADLKAQSNAKAQSVGYVPGGAGAGTGVTTEATSGVGTRDQTQNATVVVGEYAKLTAANVALTAINTGYAESHIDCGSTKALLANVNKSRQPTESWYNTLVTVGRGASIEATEGNVEILTLDAPTARSEVKSSGFSIGVNYNSMKGENEVHQENNIDIVHDASIIAAKNVHIEAWQTTYAVASTEYDGTGIVVSSNTAKAQNDIMRVVRANIGQNAVVKADDGDVVIMATAGIADTSRDLLKGHNELISTYAGVKSSGFIGLGNAKAITNLTGISEITVDSGSSIYGDRNVKLQALSTSSLSPLTLSEDRMTASQKLRLQGIGTTAEVKSSGGIPLPNAAAKANLDFDTFININKGNVIGTSAKTEYNPRTDSYQYVGSTGSKQPVSLVADKGALLLIASNDWLNVKVEAETEGKGAVGVSNATGQVDVMLTNAVWVDNTTLKAAGDVRMYTDNGGTRDGEAGKDSWAGRRSNFYVHTNSKLKAIGKAEANTRITGTQINQIRTMDEDQVLWTANPEANNSWIHIAADPTTSVVHDLKAKASVPKILGIKLGKTVSRKALEWYYFDRCDFCHTGQEWDVNPTEQEDLAVRNKKAYERALIPINDIQREVNRIGVITRAHYGEEEYLAANALYVVDVKSILERDVRLTQEQTDRYHMWTNTETFQNVYLLPNAAQLYMGRGNRPQYITDILYGDAFGDGQPRFIALYSALTDYAYGNPVISIGSTGRLNFATGELLIPSYADVELYLHEISSAWLLEEYETGFFRTLRADQKDLNESANNGGGPPEGEIIEGLFRGDEIDGWTIIWLGENPDTVEDPDQTLIFLMINAETDEVDAFRISGRMIENGEDPVDVSLYIYRDSRADRMEEEKYKVFYFDTPEGQMSVVKIMTNTVDGRSIEVPAALEVVLRAFPVKGSDMPAYSLYNCALILSERNDGTASALDGFYTATYDENTFDSPFTRVEGISTGEISITLKKDQPIWPEWTGPDTAETVDGKFYHLTEDEWKLEETALMFADANP